MCTHEIKHIAIRRFDAEPVTKHRTSPTGAVGLCTVYDICEVLTGDPLGPGGPLGPIGP